MTTQDELEATPHLHGRHQHTYEAVFRHPAARDVAWHDVRALLGAVGNVAEGQNGSSLHVSRNGHSATLHAPKHKDVSVEDLLAVRRYLEESADAVIPAKGAHLLVVIDHHEAKIYHTVSHGAVPQQLVPYDPHGFGRHLRSNAEETDGKRKPERKSFYGAIAATLRGSDRILIFGHGTGESSAMEQLLADLKHNHPDVATRVVGSVVTDGSHLTDDQLLAQAREFFASTGVEK